MPHRPLIAIRLIGDTAIVQYQRDHLVAHLAQLYGDQATCRTSTHSARHTGEIRVYLTVTTKEDPCPHHPNHSGK